MFKAPYRLVAILREPNLTRDTIVCVKDLVNYGYIAQMVGSLLVVRWGDDIYVAVYCWMDNERKAKRLARKAGFPFIANENDLTIGVGLRSRLPF